MWRKKFQQVNLDRGHQDFINHAVKSFIKRENNIHAKVVDLAEHEIEIVLNSRYDIESAQCSCDCNPSNGLCHHIATVMFCYESIIEGQTQQDKTSPNRPLEEMLNDLPKADLVQYLLELFEEETHLEHSFRMKYNPNHVLENRNTYISDIDLMLELGNPMNDHSSFYDDDDDDGEIFNPDFELEEYINYYVPPIVKKKQFDLSFDIICYILKNLNNKEVTRGIDYSYSVEASLSQLKTIIKEAPNYLNYVDTFNQLAIASNDERYQTQVEKLRTIVAERANSI